jgi:signal transduction histidine kinase
VLQELRDLAQCLVPALLLEGGLAPALAELARPMGHEMHTSIEAVGRFDSAIEQAVYCCCAEALQNASKHAGIGARFGLTLSRKGGALRSTVQDDGRGFMPSTARKELENMRRRMSEPGGRLTIGARPGGGVIVEGTLPLPEDSAHYCPPRGGWSNSPEARKKTPQADTGAHHFQAKRDRSYSAASVERRHPLRWSARASR